MKPANQCCIDHAALSTGTVGRHPAIVEQDAKLGMELARLAQRQQPPVVLHLLANHLRPAQRHPQMAPVVVLGVIHAPDPPLGIYLPGFRVEIQPNKFIDLAVLSMDTVALRKCYQIHYRYTY